MRTPHLFVAALCTVLLTPAFLIGQQNRAERPEPVPGSATVWVGDAEYKIRIECDVASQPELGFTTEPNRITRRDTGGQYNMVNLRLRPWKETGDVMVTLEGTVAWLPRPTSSGGVLAMQVDLSPASIMRDGTPVLLTYDMWNAGDRPPGRDGVRFEANCADRDPEAPAYRKIPGSGGGGGRS